MVHLANKSVCPFTDLKSKQATVSYVHCGSIVNRIAHTREIHLLFTLFIPDEKTLNRIAFVTHRSKCV